MRLVPSCPLSTAIQVDERRNETSRTEAWSDVRGHCPTAMSRQIRRHGRSETASSDGLPLGLTK
jgi:hypothetical protein